MNTWICTEYINNKPETLSIAILAPKYSSQSDVARLWAKQVDTRENSPRTVSVQMDGIKSRKFLVRAFERIDYCASEITEECL